MATIDLIVLGMLKRESLSAYDIQKLVEYRNILLGGELRETQTANYFSNFSPVDCAVPSANA